MDFPLRNRASVGGKGIAHRSCNPADLGGLYLNADSRIIHALVLKVDALRPHSVLMAALVSLGYAGMLLSEGVGLWLERSWAAYLTVISTSLLLPFELYEVIDRVSMIRVGVLLLVIALYLLIRLKKHTLHSRVMCQYL